MRADCTHSRMICSQAQCLSTVLTLTQQSRQTCCPGFIVSVHPPVLGVVMPTRRFATATAPPFLDLVVRLPSIPRSGPTG